MTREEAMQEARRRWGKWGWILRRASFFQVGTLNGANRQLCIGYGDSWEAAFADADRKEKP